jgi:Cu/Ag efflux pump CusA
MIEYGAQVGDVQVQLIVLAQSTGLDRSADSSVGSILQLAHYEHLAEVEQLPWDRETVLRGANERLIPILMTAVGTALGLLPLALGSSRAGQEIEGPKAITVLGGLLSSTILNLLVLPALAQRYAHRAA